VKGEASIDNGELRMENQEERCKTGLFGSSGRNKGEKSTKIHYFFCKTKPIAGLARKPEALNPKS
jgi:hypothetical protein